MVSSATDLHAGEGKSTVTVSEGRNKEAVSQTFVSPICALAKIRLFGEDRLRRCHFEHRECQADSQVQGKPSRETQAFSPCAVELMVDGT